ALVDCGAAGGTASAAESVTTATPPMARGNRMGLLLRSSALEQAYSRSAFPRGACFRTRDTKAMPRVDEPPPESQRAGLTPPSVRHRSRIRSGAAEHEGVTDQSAS